MSEKRESLFVPTSEAAVSIEKRGDEPRKIVGRAAVFYDGTPETEYVMYPDLKERIMPRAFNKALNDRQDVVALYNHDENILLGRSSAGTLKLSKSLRGLDYEIDPPDTVAAKELMHHIERGEVKGSSFAFAVMEQKWKTEQSAEGTPIDIREIHSVTLYDVSAVVRPAYGSTSVGLRSLDDGSEARSARDAWKAEEKRAAEARSARLKAINERAASIE